MSEIESITANQDNINALRELRKICSILDTHGNVLVNGGIPAIDRFNALMQSFFDMGYTAPAITQGLDSLSSLGY